VLAEAWGIDLHCAKKLVSPRGETAYQQARHVRRVAGFVRQALLSPAAANALVGERELPRLRRMLSEGGRYSRTGLTYYPPVDVDRMVESGQSPGSWDRWAARVMRRAKAILAGWETYPSYRALQAVLAASCGRDGYGIMPRAHRAAVKVAAVSLCLRYGGDAWEPAHSLRAARETLAGFRLFRQQSDSGLLPPGRQMLDEELRSAMDRDFGPQGDDDRIMARDYQVVAWAKNGAVIAQPLDPRGGINDRRRIVQVVVRDPANGHRHHLTVPSHFATPLRPGESAARRVHAAVAWTFSMTPDEYRPEKEA
jgi:hypothetical protein